jgi:hypothetical protein
MTTETHFNQSGQSPGPADGKNAHLTQCAPGSPTTQQPITSLPARCPSQTKAGQLCGGTPTHDGFCPQHSPRFTAGDRSGWGRRGALSNVKQRVVRQLREQEQEIGDSAPSLATSEDVRRYVERVTKRVEDGTLAPSQAGAIAQLVGLAIKLGEMELEQRLLDAELDDAAEASNPMRRVR